METPSVSHAQHSIARDGPGARDNRKGGDKTTIKKGIARPDRRRGGGEIMLHSRAGPCKDTEQVLATKQKDINGLWVVYG